MKSQREITYWEVIGLTVQFGDAKQWNRQRRSKG